MMEVSVKYAIAKAKRNIENSKYSKSENILDAILQYNIREDEVPMMIESINKWLNKNYWLGSKYNKLDVQSILKSM